MKPDEAAAQQAHSTSRGVGVVPQQGVAPAGAAAPPASGSHAAVFANGSSLLQGVDLSSAAGMQKLEGLLKGKSFLGGSRPGAEDACVFAAASSLPSAVLRAAPAVKGWLNTVGMFAPSMRAGWGGGSAAAAGKTSGGEKKAAKAPSAAQTARSIETGGGDDDVDSLFGDDEEEDGGGGGGPSRAEQMAAAKAEKDKKKKLDRSQVVLEVKPWEAGADLNGLFEKIRKVKIEGLNWGEAHKLVAVAFGVKKLVISAVIEDEKVGVEDITDAIEAFEDEVQSVDMTTMNRL